MGGGQKLGPSKVAGGFACTHMSNEWRRSNFVSNTIIKRLRLSRENYIETMAKRGISQPQEILCLGAMIECPQEKKSKLLLICVPETGRLQKLPNVTGCLVWHCTNGKTVALQGTVCCHA